MKLTHNLATLLCHSFSGFSWTHSINYFLCGVSYILLVFVWDFSRDFSSISPKNSGGCTGYAKLPLSVDPDPQLT